VEHIKRKNCTRHFTSECELQYTLKSEVPVAIMASFCSYAPLIINEEQCKKLLCNEYNHYGKCGQKA